MKNIIGKLLMRLPRVNYSILALCSLVFISTGTTGQGATTLLSETFEGSFPAANGWSVGDSNTSGTLAYWDDVDSAFGGEGTHSGSWKGYCAGFGFAGTASTPIYQSSMTSYMSKTIDLRGYSSATLSCWYRIPAMEAGSYDKCRIYIDSDLIFERTVAVTSWTEKTQDLTPYVGGTHTLKFEFVSDSSGTAEGWYLDDITVTATATASQPNLTPYKPADWSDKIVVSKTTGTHTDSSPLYTTDNIYIDFAAINNGSAATSTKCYTEIYVDGVLKNSWYIDPPLAANSAQYSYVEDISIGTLSANTHTIKIKTDSSGVIAESNEGDNEYTKTITVISPAVIAPSFVDADCYVSPSVTTPGGRLTVYYRIYNPNASSLSIGLGCSIKKNGTTTWLNDIPNDVYRTVPSGYSTQSRYFDIPSGTHGSYDVDWGLWPTIGTGSSWDNCDKLNQLTVNRAPNAPGQLSMNHDSGNDTGQSQYDAITKNGKPAFSWTAVSDPDGDAISGYYVSYTDSTPDADDFWVTTTSWSPGFWDSEIPEGSRTLYVCAKDALGGIGSVASLSFTIDKTPLSPPLFVVPSEGQSLTDVSPTLDWQDVSGAWKYQVYVREDGLPYLDSRTSPEITASTWTVAPDLGLKSWGWQVKTWDIAGNEGSYGYNGAPDAWGHFTVVPPSCTIQLTVRDVNNQPLVGCKGEYYSGGELRWSKDTDASGFASDANSPGDSTAFCRAKTISSHVDVKDEDWGGWFGSEKTVEWDTPVFPTVTGGTFSKTISLNNSDGVNASEASVVFREITRAWEYAQSTYSYQRELATAHVDAAVPGAQCNGNTLFYKNGVAVLRAGLPGAASHTDDTIAHEYGHALLFAAQEGWGAASDCTCFPDHNHGWMRNFDNDCSFDAFTEGWAEFFAVSMYHQYNSADSCFGDSRGGYDINLENLDGIEGHGWRTTPDERNEFSFAAVLWDIYDRNNEAGDTLSLDDAGMWQVWTVLEGMASSPKTVESFFKVFCERWPDKASALEQIYILNGMHPKWLKLSQNSLDFGRSSVQQSFIINRVGWYGDGTPEAVTPDWNITKDVDWITSISPSTGDTTTEDDTVTVTINRNGLAAGVNVGHLTVRPGHYGLPQTITVMATKASRVQLKPAPSLANEGGSIRLYVSRAEGSSGAATVNFSTANDTAVAGSDYIEKSGTLNWTDGDASDKYIDVLTIDDGTAENEETFTVSLNAVSGASLGSPSTIAVTIADNDSAPLYLSEIGVSTDGFRLMVNGPIGSTCVTEVSSNLVEWFSLFTNTIPANGSIQIIDPEMKNHDRRFYRLITP